VRDLCLRVQSGECFGFLGVNGAGKTTTTFSMLTGALQPSSGDATLRGLSILSSQDELRKLVGFCPQHDALESLLTPRETLCLYAHIKGVPTEHIPAEVEGLLRDLDLKMFEHKQAGTLSGGNKRKLCVGVALIGSPLLLLLDEPSSGMDAASKRFLWAVIKRRTVDCCTVLTTHSMEECEALCSRIGVMVAGSMRCLGPIQTLKSRYGQGFKLDLRLGPNAPSLVETVVELVAQGCPGTTLEESEPPCLTLTIPQRDLTLAAIFAHMSHVRERCDVIECSLTQCTLEQVFLLMASKQGLRSSASGDALEEG
jgi:ABC-type multidrug transport system ATPase subunit